MRKLLWIGQPGFANSLEACGWETATVRTPPAFRIFTWQQLVGLAGFEPDILVVEAGENPPWVLNPEDFPCLTVCHYNILTVPTWQPVYAQAFDACMVSVVDYLSEFAGEFLPRERIWWSPPFASDAACPGEEAEKKWDCLFVGVNDSQLFPKRWDFLSRLAQYVPGLHILCGEYGEAIRQGHVLINQAEQDELDSRVFEALGQGACLVTPRVGHGLDNMFVDGEHLVGYKSGDVGDAAYRINFLLEHPELRSHIAATGLAEIDARHRARHRAETFTDHICDLAMADVTALVSARKQKAEFIRKQTQVLPYSTWSLEMPAWAAEFQAAGRGKFGLAGPYS